MQIESHEKGQQMKYPEGPATLINFPPVIIFKKGHGLASWCKAGPVGQLINDVASEILTWQLKSCSGSSPCSLNKEV